MIVTRQDVDKIIDSLRSSGKRGLDVETTGLTQDDRIFSLIIADEHETYYFNFKLYSSCLTVGFHPDYFLDAQHVYRRLNEEVFSNPESTWYIHNAKFDMRMVFKEGCTLEGRVHCSYAVERVLKNNLMGKSAYKLEGLALRRGYQKDDAVEEYIKKHKLITKVNIPGKKKVVELKHFDQVPFNIIAPYGERDGHLHRTIGLMQEIELAALEASKPPFHPSYYPVVENEIRLTKTLFRMEDRGVKIDRPFVAKALEYEIDQVRQAEKSFLEFTGEVFTDSNKPLSMIFDRLGEKYPTTEKGNPSFAADVLEEMTTPVAALINKIRYHEKRAGTYYSSFLHFADSNDIIHADARQAGTETGRFSYRDPNLQNVPKEDEQEDEATPYHVRQSFIPRDGHFFYSKDFRQQEFRMMLDYAGELALIKAINEGEDVHEATAKLCGITRKQAKTINFGLLYGMGVQKLAAALGLSVKQAKELRALYFGRLPKVRDFIDNVIQAGESRGYIYNWAGRRCHVARRDWAYILPNHLIQGGCADVIKFAMNQIDQYLIDNRLQTRMLLQVHDELLFECPFGEEKVIEELGRIMESVYKPQNGMILTTSTEHSFKSWGFRDKIEGTPYGEKTKAT